MIDRYSPHSDWTRMRYCVRWNRIHVGSFPACQSDAFYDTLVSVLGYTNNNEDTEL